MKKEIITVATIGIKSALKWGFILFIGNLISVIIFFTVIYSNKEFFGGGGHSNGFAAIFTFLTGLFSNNIFAFLSLVLLPAIVTIYFILANKTAIQNTIYLIWKGSTGDYISSKVKSILINITQNEGWRKEIANKARLKAKVMQATANDSNTSKIQRRVIKFGFKKMKLNDINFQDERLDIPETLTNRFNNFVTNTTRPSFLYFWILVIFQMTLFILSL